MVENMNPQLLNGGVTRFSLHLINIEISWLPMKYYQYMKKNSLKSTSLDLILISLW